METIYTRQISGNVPGPSGSATPSGYKYSRYNRSGYTSPGGYSNYSAGTADRVGCLASVRMTAWAKVTRFTRRLVRFRQMDFEFAAWQMLYLLVQPQKVYRNFLYRKRTKDQFARDDPAFLVLLAASLLITSVLYAVCLGLSTWGFIKFFLWVVAVDCLIAGAIVATCLWFISNRWLRKVNDQDVEWGYCFDVHLNAFFPFLILVHVLLPLIYPPLINSPTFMARFFGNAVWFSAGIYYVYITFLGYTALPHLKNTHFFLYPMSFLFMMYIATVTAGWNISQTAMSFYHARAETHNANPGNLYPELNKRAL
ncbi:unnamed protein product, partial [Mesorhabditis belari]|uniref:Uncharacterized protein n=1 Tax=Mesorhabditis belari TaxID=2138241 RepID=A0AAF3EBN8_9BILA